MFTDTHCHILSEYYQNIEDVVSLAQEKGINRFIDAGYNFYSSLEIIKLVDKHPEIYGVIGLHPENCLEDFNFKIFSNLTKKIIGIGEIGLDYHYGKDNILKQKEIFELQLRKAEELHLPVVIHSRDATEDTINILKKYHVKGIIHSFSGSFETAQIYLKMGFKLGVNGVITFKNAKLKEVFEKLSPHDIVLETDSPYLTPEPFRGTLNSPANIFYIASFLAKLYDISLAELAEITNQNIKQIFDI